MCGLGPLPVPTIRTLAGAHDEVVEAARPFVDRWRHAPLGRRRLQDSWMVLGCGLLDSCRSAPSRSNQRKRVDLLNTYSNKSTGYRSSVASWKCREPNYLHVFGSPNRSNT